MRTSASVERNLTNRQPSITLSYIQIYPGLPATPRPNPMPPKLAAVEVELSGEGGAVEKEEPIVSLRS